MQQLELKALIGRLSRELRQGLETAAALCVRRGHHAVEVEHWLLQLCKETGSGMSRIIDSQQLSRQTMIGDLEQRLNRLPSGYEQTPALAQITVSLIQDAWLLASVNFQQNEISVSHWMLALLDKDSFNLVETPLTREFQKISREKLRTFSSAHSMVQETGSGQVVGPGADSALDKYTINMTREAGVAGDKGADIVGRTSEIRQIVDILCRRRQNNPILIGDAGVGKTAIVEGLARQVVRGDVPENLKDVEIRSLDPGLLQAGASIKGEFERRLKDVMNEVRQSPVPVIVFIDEAHTLVGAGGAAGQNDAASLLKPALARGEFRTIAATTWAEYKKHFEKDAALTRRFQPVKVLEPDETTAIQMTRVIARTLEQHHGVRVHDDAVISAVRLSVRYLPERQLPDKAISLLDTACSGVSLSLHTTPAILQSSRERKRYLESELEELKRDLVVGSSEPELIEQSENQLTEVKKELTELEKNWQQEQLLVQELTKTEQELDAGWLASGEENPELKSKLKELQQQLHTIQGEQPLVHGRVDTASVAAVVAGWTGIPVGDMLRDEIHQLMQLEDSLQQRIIGQNAAIAEIARSVRIGRAGLSDPGKPVGVFLMCGPSGVGKTETGLALADQLYGGEQNLTIINMTEFKEEHKVSMLLGAPAGYVGYGEGGVLTEAVRRCPYSVLLLDEMEKAHPGVHDIFYRIFDKGRITDSEGREVDFRQTIIIMTSNAADAAICDLAEQYELDNRGMPDREAILEAINNDLLQFFKPAFLGRVTLVPYLPLNDEDMAKICRLTLRRMEKNLAGRYGATLRVDDAVIRQLVKWSNSPQTGARAIEQQVNRNLMPELAAECLARLAEGKPIQSVAVGLRNHRLTYSINGVQK